MTKYPDVKIDQLVSLLMMRGDVGRGDARQVRSSSLQYINSVYAQRFGILMFYY